MPPSEGETAPDFETLYCDGETFRAGTLADRLDGGAVLVFSGFAFNAINENWYKQYDRAGWATFDVPVVGVFRDGPYAVNAFLRDIDSPFGAFADVEATAAADYGLLTERPGMAGVRTAQRAVFVLDDDRTIRYSWVGDDWISPVPRDEIEAAVARL
ncbi:redoxin domain-containing protein [Halosegnis sp.]|uniref:redoxin domain-containing protein n=1 Tax=Halosegnis sp. TaxID=2864959 RepID=UPI0035D4C4D7